MDHAAVQNPVLRARSRLALRVVVAGMLMSAAGLLLSQPPYDLWWLAPVSLVPWMWVASGRSVVFGATSGFVLGTVIGLGMTVWIHEALQSLGAPPLQAALGSFLTAAWGAGVHWMALGVAVSLSMRLSGWRRAISLGFGVFAIDWCWLLMPGSLPWVLLGHSQWTATGVSQLAAAGGVPLVSGLLAALAGGAAEGISSGGVEVRRSALRCFVVLAASFLACLLGGEAASRWARPAAMDPARFRVLLVQPNLPPGDRWARAAQRTNLATISRQTLAALDSSVVKPELIAWPETTLTQPVGPAGPLRSDLLDWLERFDTPLLLGAVRAPSSSHAGTYRNSALWLDASGDQVGAMDKSRAIPVVEAASASALLRALRGAVGLGSLEAYAEEVARQTPVGVAPSFAVTLCFESVFPWLSHARRDDRSAALLNLANDSWFRSDVPSRQQIAFASFRAIEQRLPLYRVAHSGASVEIDAFGSVQQQLAFGRAGEIWAELDRHPAPVTLTERLTPLAVAAAGSLVGLFFFSIAYRRIP